tara:strand:- start:3013 stop:3348 length:336 start_codon:yes stop_codon:yes gene_type:complete
MKVYYNGSCNICNTEIGYYKKKNKHINFIDISRNKDQNILHISKKQLFRRMHVLHEGKIISGAESFIVLWSKMDKWRYLSILLSLPIFKQLWKLIYEMMAIFLYLKNRSKI